MTSIATIESLNFAQTYTLAAKVKEKLQRDVHKSDSNLRIIILQSNMLDKIIDHLQNKLTTRTPSINSAIKFTTTTSITIEHTKGAIKVDDYLSKDMKNVNVNEDDEDEEEDEEYRHYFNCRNHLTRCNSRPDSELQSDSESDEEYDYYDTEVNGSDSDSDSDSESDVVYD
ncbi:uncharacterized protein RJT21DRAFT_14780 [Scheffersomyces amazonensis]|uniref:uncharacterized protein n=1 Tax=Scheffersomyces amazonensis TaxID=1078765 RepID=UPI00315C6713